MRIDLLLPDAATGGRHHLVEVKSTASVKDYHLPDAAIQAWVARKAGLDLATVSIAHLDTDFVYPGGGDYRGLLQQEDVTAALADLVEEVPDWADQARSTLSGGMPEVEPGKQCSDPFDCPFQQHCSPETAEYPVGLLPGRLGKTLGR